MEERTNLCPLIKECTIDLSPTSRILFVPDAFFVGEPVWTPINRPIGDDHPSRHVYVEHLYRNGETDEGKSAVQVMS